MWHSIRFNVFREIRSGLPGGGVIDTSFYQIIPNTNLLLAYSFHSSSTSGTNIGNVASGTVVYDASINNISNLSTTNVLYGDRCLTNALLTINKTITFTTNGLTFSWWVWSTNPKITGQFGFAPVGYNDTNSIFCYGGANNIMQYWDTVNWTPGISIPNIGNSSWHHLVITITYGTMTASTCKVYYDNSIVLTNACYYPPSQSYTINIWNALKGSKIFPSTANYTANIRVYNRVITLDEINTLFVNKC